MEKRDAEFVDTIVIGAGQAGLSVGYHLARRGRSFLILDAGERVGDSWRNRWDSLRLFTPARYDGLDGMPFPGDPNSFPTKNQMADYLEAYARRFNLPIRTGVKVDSVTRDARRYVVSSGDHQFSANHIVVAMANYQVPHVPAFAREMDASIVQIHSGQYRNPAQLREGAVLIVGAGNSGADIGLELARSHRIWLSGRDTGEVPFRIESLAARVLVPLVLRVLFHRVLTVRTPMGRRMRPRVIAQGGPRIRVKARDLTDAGVERVGRVAGVRGGRPVLADGRTIDAANVIWCTGFRPGFDWIHLPAAAGVDEPRHEEGVVRDEPGLYFVGLHFEYAFSSTMIHGVGRDAERIVRTIETRDASAATAPADGMAAAGVDSLAARSGRKAAAV
jgi:putative flavoprotein involved in K+ transport